MHWRGGVRCGRRVTRRRWRGCGPCCGRRRHRKCRGAVKRDLRGRGGGGGGVRRGAGLCGPAALAGAVKNNWPALSGLVLAQVFEKVSAGRSAFFSSGCSGGSCAARRTHSTSRRKLLSSNQRVWQPGGPSWVRPRWPQKKRADQPASALFQNLGKDKSAAADGTFCFI